MLAQEVRKPVQKLYSQMDYFQFCEYMGLNPKYDMKYWEMFQQLSSSLSAFDDEQLQKIINFPVSAQQAGAADSSKAWQKITNLTDDDIEAINLL